MIQLERNNVTRRQFLTYTLTGVGGFMGAGTLMPMLRFAIDPVLQQKTDDGMVAVTRVEKLTSKPQKLVYKVHQLDGWYEDDFPYTAWIYKDKNDKIVALSPVCQHLGCTVSWYDEGDHANKFFCQCHGGLYEKNGKNVKGSPPLRPLDLYEYKVKNGDLYLGRTVPNKV